jgi:hypothetical protein
MQRYGKQWNTRLREWLTSSEYTEPHHPQQNQSPTPGADFIDTAGHHVEDGHPTASDIKDEDRQQAPIDPSKAEENKPKPTEDDFHDILTNALTLIAQTNGLISNYIVGQGMLGEQSKPFQSKMGKFRIWRKS